MTSNDYSASENPEKKFRVITHKPGLLALFSPFGGFFDVGTSVDPATAADDHWWMSQDWASQVLRAGIEMPQLTAPTPGWIAGLDQRWLNRRVGTLRVRDLKGFFAKHPSLVKDHPTVVVSVPGEFPELVPPSMFRSEDLAQGQAGYFSQHLPGHSMIQLDEILPCVVESRFWVADGEISASCPYRIGMVGWDSALFTEILLNPEAHPFLEQLHKTAQDFVEDVDGPPGYVFDMGITVEDTVTVLRSWPSWSVDPLSADINGVYRSLKASHDFTGEHFEWRWTPDLSVYSRQPVNSPGSAEDVDPTGPRDEKAESLNDC